MAKKESAVLALDIGGTNTRLGIAKDNKLVAKKTYPTKKLMGLLPVMKEFLKNNKKYSITMCGIGFAGPIVGKKAELTNADLKIDKAELEKYLNINVTLVNDFFAVGKGVSVLQEKDLYSVRKTGFNNNVQMVVGPGTGLGKAYVIDGKVVPGEGGQTLAGIKDIHDYQLIESIKKKKSDIIYYEDLISGRGIVNIYRHLAIKSNIDRDSKVGIKINSNHIMSAETVTSCSKNDELCNLTLMEFTKFYARFVRDSALHLIPSHIYLAGGISPVIIDYIKKYFLAEFTEHRAYSALLNKMSISVVLNTDVGL
ncbi:MAG: ROK family protein, partial [Nanoarchaeota archaeon]|nr:ROK family protein [Nanoarchaeota archaeon]